MSLVTSKMKQLNAKFVEACFDGLHKDVERLLAEGAVIESCERNGYSALSEACVAGQTVVVGMLLRALANPNSKANDGRTPLHRAAFHGWQPVITLLLDHGADPTIRDESGVTAADLARNLLVRQQIKDFPAEKTEAAKEERKRQLALRPPPPQPKFEEDAAPASSGNDEPQAAELSFRPPPRGSAAAKAAAKAEAQAAAEAKKKEIADKLKAEKERREQRRKEAIEEMKQMVTNGEDLGESGYSVADAPRPLTARVQVQGAGDDRLNGLYQVQFATKDRVEFYKVNDEACQIFWSSWQDEWRMLIADYKMASTLYRNAYRPNWKADECNGCPENNWQKWFGKEGSPTIRLIPDPDEVVEEESPAGDEAAGGNDAAQPAVASDTPSQADDKPKKTQEFLELHSNLNIVNVDDGAARRQGVSSSPSSASNARHIQLTAGGERIVETADGLFGANEVQEAADSTPTVVEVTEDSAARLWLESTGTPEIPSVWESIVAAKGTAQELYAEQKIREAVQATTAAITALKKFASADLGAVDDLADSDEAGATQTSHRPSEDEIDGMRGVLHSNRSLLLQHQISAGDEDVMKFGADAAWRLVVADADVALGANPTNFKASFRRARALLELGELEEALQDATNVVDHYASTSSTPNPEAAALRERILDAIKKERGKWGEKGPRRWNRTAKDIIEEVSSSSTSKVESDRAGREKKSKPSAMPWDSKPAPTSLPQRLPDASSKPLPAPRTSSDVEKALLTTLKSDQGLQLEYVRQHLSIEAFRKFYKRCPLGPDMLARLIRICSDLAEEDAPRAEELLCALAAAPSSKTDAAMFDAEEQAVLQRLNSRLGTKATEAWAD